MRVEHALPVALERLECGGSVPPARLLRSWRWLLLALAVLPLRLRVEGAGRRRLPPADGGLLLRRLLWLGKAGLGGLLGVVVHVHDARARAAKR